jgi:hypothetical protein
MLLPACRPACLQEILVLCIGLGVGVAAVIGTLRFICDW